MEGTPEKRADYRPVICPVCKKPMSPRYGPCPDCVRKAKILSDAKARAEETYLKSDEVCGRCRAAFAVKEGLCENCLNEAERERAAKSEEKKNHSKRVAGEERYKSVPPSEDRSNYSFMSSDTVENIERCLNCEIPPKYCRGGNCVAAYRRWRASVKSRKRRGLGVEDDFGDEDERR
ncbi:MAG: hypothetical protein LUD72_08810 [Bacteroidales bacterium]|nr:hypothetical protein [Bacteroidales bacterium]